MNKTPESSGATVIYREFGFALQQPLKGGIPLDQFVRDVEANASMAERLATARRQLVGELGEQNGFVRALRLAAGLSQSGLAVKAGATQSYIARIEAGSVDPGTDMIARLAAALDVSSGTVFEAVRKQREMLDE